MSNSIKEQFSDDFQKAKNVGGTRVERIRKIFQDALAQTAAELKEGTGEIQSIAKGSTSTLIESLKEKKEANQTAPIPVEVTIETDEHSTEQINPIMTDVKTDEVIVVVDQPEVAVKPTQMNQEQPINNHSSEMATDDAITDEAIIEAIAQPLIEFSQTNEQIQTLKQEKTENATENVSEGETVHGLLDSMKALIEQAILSLKQGETQATLQQQFTKLKEQLAVLDTKLTARYGNRYEAIKQDFRQDFEKAKTWYEGAKSDAAASGTNWVEQKQSEVEVKMSEAGATIAQKEQKIKQLLKELWQTIRS